MSEPCDKCGKLDANKCLECNPVRDEVIQHSDELVSRTPSEKAAYLEGVTDGKMYAVRDGLTREDVGLKNPLESVGKCGANKCLECNQCAAAETPTVAEDVGVVQNYCAWPTCRGECVLAAAQTPLQVDPLGAMRLVWKGSVCKEGLPEGTQLYAEPQVTHDLSLMRNAFRVTEMDGDPDPSKQRFHMRFTFNSLEELHKADDQWQAFAKTGAAIPGYVQRVEPTDRQIMDAARVLHSAYNLCPDSVLGQPARMRWMAEYFLTNYGIPERKGELKYTAGEMEHYANAFANARDRRRVTENDREAAEEAWSRRVGSCNTKQTCMEKVKEDFMAGFTRGLIHARSAQETK
jgi:hypothetical protein